MSWNQIIGHQGPLSRFKTSVARNKLASTYLFVGPEGIGKRTFALKLAQAVLCETNPIERLEPCGQCSGCVQVEKRTHPDLILVSKPNEKSILPVELFIGKGDKRRRQGLVYEIGLKPFCGGHRIAIVDDADYFNAESANCLLKTLEEPPPNSLLILLGTSQQRQLQTIVSRSQVVRFDPLTNDQVQQVIDGNDLLSGGEDGQSMDVAALAQASGGSVARAVKFADPEVFQFRQTLFERLSTGDPHAGEFAKQLIGFAESAGKENYRKRRQVGLAADLAIEFFRACCLSLSGAKCLADETLAASVQRFVDRYAGNEAAGAEFACNCIDRCSDFRYHVFANSGLPNAIDSWLVDLGRLGRGELVTTGNSLAGAY
jgi:DNA polymerase-3 subunit delta'